MRWRGAHAKSTQHGGKGPRGAAAQNHQMGPCSHPREPCSPLQLASDVAQGRVHVDQGQDRGPIPPVVRGEVPEVHRAVVRERHHIPSMRPRPGHSKPARQFLTTDVDHVLQAGTFLAQHLPSGEGRRGAIAPHQQRAHFSGGRAGRGAGGHLALTHHPPGDRGTRKAVWPVSGFLSHRQIPLSFQAWGSGQCPTCGEIGLTDAKGRPATTDRGL